MKKKYWVILFISFAILFSGYGQSTTINYDRDSLKSLKGKSRIKLLISIAEEYMDSNLDSSLYFANEAYSLAEQSQTGMYQYESAKIIADAWYYKNEQTLAIDYYRIAADIVKQEKGNHTMEYASRISDIGYCYYILQIYDLAVANYSEALNIFTVLNNKLEISNQLNNIGTVYFNWGKYNLALEYFSRTLKYDMERDDSSQLSTSYNNIGKVYESWGYYDIAIDHYLKSLDYLSNTNNESKKAIRLSNIGTSYYNKNEYEIALKYLNSALEIDQRLGNEMKVAIRFNEIANVLMEMGKYAEAIKYNVDALRIFESLDLKESIAITLNDLGRIYLKIPNNSIAENYFLKSALISREIKSLSNEMTAYKLLAETFEKSGNYKQALVYHRKFDEINDTIFNEKTHKQLANYRIRYETEKQVNENELLRKDLQIRTRRQRAYAMIGLLMLISTILLILLLRLKSRTIKQNRILYEQDVKLANLQLEKQTIENQHLEDKIFAEKQLNRLQHEKHDAEIKLKNKELVSSTLQLVNKNEVLSEIKEKVNRYNSAIPENAYKDVIMLINQNTDFDQNWKRFSIEFEESNPGFFDRIRYNYPDFSEQFIRLSALLRLDLTTNEIAQLMNVSVAAVNKNRQRLRKKLNLEPEADLSAFMKSL
jgi:tetratricopeptide (TPR) repeat protein